MRDTFGGAQDHIYAVFAGNGTKQALLDEADQCGARVFWAEELSKLLATSLFRYRKRFE